MQVQCPNCSKVFPVTAKVAGRKAKCGCGTVLQMPELNPAASPVAALKIEMSCESCNRRLSVPANAAGKLVNCPCGVQSQVPSAGAAPPPANAPYGMPTDNFGNDSYANDPFDSAGSGGGHAEASGPAYLTAPKPRPKVKKKKKKGSSGSSSGGSFGPNFGQVFGGLAMMVGAVVWFGVAWCCGVIFPYSLVLLGIGFITMIKGFIAP